MKNVQKFEICAGLTTLLAVLPYFYVFVALDIEIAQENQDSIAKILLQSFLLLILPALLTAIGAYFHAVKHSWAGLGLLVFGSAILILFFGILLFTGATFYYYGWIGGLLAVTPGVFATLTIYFALRSRKFTSTSGLT